MLSAEDTGRYPPSYLTPRDTEVGVRMVAR